MAWKSPDKADWADLGVWVGGTAPSAPKTVGEWQRQRTGYFAWLDVSAVSAALSITPAAASMLLEMGIPTVDVGGATHISPAAAAMLLAAGVPSVVVDRVIAPTAAAMAMAAGTPTVVTSGDTVVGPEAAAMLLACGTPSVVPGLAIWPSVADMTMTAPVPSVSVGSGASSVFGNAGFEDALAGSLGTGNWYPTTAEDGGAPYCIADRTTDNALVGSYSGRIWVQGLDNGDTIYTDSTGRLTQRLTASSLDSTPTIAFKIRSIANNPEYSPTNGRVGLEVILRNGSGTDITNKTSDKNFITLFGTFGANANTSADIGSPASNTTYDVSLNLKTIATAMLASGTWADVANVDLSVYAYSNATGLQPQHIRVDAFGAT